MYGQSVVTSGFIEISVKSLGGNSECSVSSIVLTMTGSDVGSVPQGVEVSVSRGGLSSVGVLVPLPQVGKNTVYAVGVCQSGGTTERSNVLSVLYEASGGVPSPPTWVNVGSPGFSAGPALFTSLALDSANTPCVAYIDGGNSNKATVQKFVAGTWTVVGTAGFSAGQASFTSLALDSANTPYVAYMDGGNSNKATVQN